MIEHLIISSLVLIYLYGPPLYKHNTTNLILINSNFHILHAPENANMTFLPEPERNQFQFSTQQHPHTKSVLSRANLS